MSLKDRFFKPAVLLPPLFLVATNLISSFVTRIFIDGKVFDFTTAADKSIPFVPEFIFIYFLAFVQWAICIVSLMITDNPVCRRYCIASGIANILSGVVFFIVPTVMTIRPEFSGGGALAEFIGKFLFAADTPPKNILPSVHCLQSWGCMRMVFASKRVPRYLKVINAVFSFLVFASVLFVKQHLIIDVPAGIAVFELGFCFTVIAEKFTHRKKNEV